VSQNTTPLRIGAIQAAYPGVLSNGARRLGVAPGAQARAKGAQVMSRVQHWFFGDGAGSAPPATLLVRLIVGGVFFASGAVKFLYNNQGSGRFAKLGIPAPDALAPFVGGLEIVGGVLIIIGFLTRLAAVPLIVDMLVAIASSKLPLLTGPGPEPVAAAPKTGFWAFAYQARLDLTMLLCVAFLLVVGAGAWSVDAWLARQQGPGSAKQTAQVRTTARP
jgi:putative oxidoreductase